MKRMKIPLYAKTSTFTSAFEKVKRDKARKDIFIRLSNSKGMYKYKLHIYYLL